MKQNFLVSLVLCVTFSVTAQDANDSTQNATHQLGINTTFFFKQFLNFSDNIIEPVSPYIVTYTMLKGKNGVRLGVGGSYSSSEEEDDDSQFTRKTTSGTFDFRVGWEFQKKISKRWLFFFGMDVIVPYEIDKVTTELLNFQFPDKTTTETKTTGFGAGPVVGIQINVHDRVSLFTETALYFESSKTEEKERFDSFPNNNDKRTEKVKDLSFVLPTSLFLVVRFYK